MNTMHLKDIHHFHTPDIHHVAEHFDHLIHDYRFWVVASVLVYLAIIAAAVMLGGRVAGGDMPAPLPYMYGY